MVERKTRLDFYLKGRNAELNSHLLMRLIRPNIPSTFQKDIVFAELFEGANLIFNHLKKWSLKGDAAWDDAPSFKDLKRYADETRDSYWHGSYPNVCNFSVNSPYVILYKNIPIIYLSVAYAWMLSDRATLNTNFQHYLEKMSESNWEHGILYRRCMETAEMVVEDLKEESMHYAEAIADDTCDNIIPELTEEEIEEMIQFDTWQKEALSNYERIKKENEDLKEQLQKEREVCQAQQANQEDVQQSQFGMSEETMDSMQMKLRIEVLNRIMNKAGIDSETISKQRLASTMATLYRLILGQGTDRKLKENIGKVVYNEKPEGTDEKVKEINKCLQKLGDDFTIKL